jgi:O-antigen ligase
MSGNALSRNSPVVPVLQWVQLACLAWVIWLPVSMGMVLYPALLLVFATSAGLLALRRWRPSRGLLVAWGIYYAWAVAWILVSASWGNPGVVHQGALWLGLPVLWGTWALSLEGDHLRRTLRVLLAVGSLGAALTIWLAASGAWGAPELPGWLVAAQDTRVVASRSGAVEVNYLGLSSLVGTGALAIAAFLLPGRDTWLPARPLLAVAAGLHVVAATVSGRRGILLTFLVAVAVSAAVGLVLAVRRRAGARSVLTYVGGLLGVAVALVGFALTPAGTNLSDFAGDVGARFGVVSPDATGAGTGGEDEGEEPDAIADLTAESDRLRGEQFRELVDAWRDSPVWGHGFGATLESNFARSESRPWMFEAEPLQVLMNAGLLGLVLIAVPLVLLLVGAVQALRTGRHVRATISGLAVIAAVGLACATNPYLQAPGHGWMLFLAGGITHAVTASVRPTDAGAVEEGHPAEAPTRH